MIIAALISFIAAEQQAEDDQRQIKFSYTSEEGLYEMLSTYMLSFDKANKLLDYGCWCRLRTESGIVAGHGAPVDEIDAACKAWRQCRACTSTDFESCDPDTITYTIQRYVPNPRIQCTSTSSCAVSMTYVTQSMFNSPFDMSLKYQYSNFRPIWNRWAFTQTVIIAQRGSQLNIAITFLR